MNDEVTRQQAERIIFFLKLRYDYHRIDCSDCLSASYTPEGNICSDCDELHQIEEALNKWYEIKWRAYQEVPV